MKQVYIYLIIFYSNTIFAQCYFHKLYTYSDNNDFNDGGNSIICLNNREFIISGRTLISSNNMVVYNIKIDNCGDTIWQKIYDYSVTGVEEGKSILSINNNHIITGNRYNIIEGKRDGFLIKIDSNGNVLHESAINLGINDLHSAAILDDKQIVTCGFYNEPLPNCLAFIAKTDSLGNILWQKDYGDTTQYTYPTNINKTFDGGYVISGRLSFPANWFMIKVDSMGNQEWKKVYDKTLSQTRAYNIVTKDSGHVLVGNTELSNNINAAYIMKTNSNGDTLWTKQYGNDHYYRLIKELEDGNFIMVGGKREADRVFYVWILKLDTEGNIIWEQKHSYYPPLLNYNVDNYAEDFTITPEGDIAITGYILPGAFSHTTGNDMFILKTDSCGYLENDSIDAQFTYEQTSAYDISFTNQSQHYCTPLWYFGDGDSLYTNNPIHTYNDTGTYTVTLIVRAGNSLDTITQQVSVNGIVGIDDPQTPKGGLRVYPNPAREEITIEIQNTKHKIASVRVYDVAGKTQALPPQCCGGELEGDNINTNPLALWALPLKKGESGVSLNLKSFATGLYFIEVTLSNGSIERGKFIKE